MKILLLDDDDRDVPAIVDVWTQGGQHEVVQVFDWHDLENTMTCNNFDATLIDLMIPALDLPAGECSAGFTTGEYIYQTHIYPKMADKPFAVFSAALLGLDIISAAKERLSKYPGYRGYFEKGCKNSDVLNAISK